MSVNSEEYKEIQDTLQKAQEKVEKLRDQRDEMLDANRKLVDLVKKLEVALEESEGGKVTLEESEYSFDDGWTPTDIIHDQNLDIGSDPSLDEIDSQVDEAIKSMKRVQDFINK